MYSFSSVIYNTVIYTSLKENIIIIPENSLDGKHVPVFCQRGRIRLNA